MWLHAAKQSSLYYYFQPQISTKMIEKASVVDDESRPCTVRPSVTVSREKPPVSLCGAVTLTEVKALMKEWITSSPCKITEPHIHLNFPHVENGCEINSSHMVFMIFNFAHCI